MNQSLKIDPYGFREYDARWVYGKDINAEGITNLGKGFGTQIIKHTKKNNPRVIVGHDYRSYSEEIKAALKKGLISTGCFVEDIGLSLSPMVYFAQFDLDSDAIAMVTASHNENGWTGVKMGIKKGLTHAATAIKNGKHIIMVNVEADALAGVELASMAEKAGVIYSLAYGDQPALTCEMVDWARSIGFEIIAAGKGTKYLPKYHASTPDTVWEEYGLTAKEAEQAGMNSKMFNSFLDGTKSAIEMAALSNATGLSPPEDGLQFPSVGIDDLANVLKPRSDGGILEKSGQVEVVSSLKRNGTSVFKDLPNCSTMLLIYVPLLTVISNFTLFFITDNNFVFSTTIFLTGISTSWFCLAYLYNLFPFTFTAE